MVSTHGGLAAVVGLSLLPGCGRHPFADPIDGSTGDAVNAPVAPLHLRFEASDFLSSGVGVAACVETCPGVTPSLAGHGEAAQFVAAGGIEVTGLEGTTPPALTAALWLRFDAPAQQAPMSLFSRAFDPLNGSANTWELYVQAGPRLHMGTTTDDTLDGRLVGLAAGVPEVGRWTHVTLTFDERGRRLYVDGALRLADDRGPLVYDGTPLLIGIDRDRGEIVNHLIGALDDVMLFERALSPAEVAALAVP